MYQVVVSIYAYILRFLIRSLGWYQESRLKHALHAITRPLELRYNDILDKISALSQNLNEIGQAGAHAEQRDMHSSIRQLLQGQDGLRNSIDQLAGQVAKVQMSLSADRALNDCARVEFRQRLSEIQLASFVHHIRAQPLSEPREALQTTLFLVAKRSLKKSNRGWPDFWMDERIQQWNKSQVSAFVGINGTWKARFQLQRFCAASIVALQDAQVPVLWALKSIALDQAASEDVCSVDLLKYLVVQAVMINEQKHSDAALAPYVQSYRRAKTEDEWISILVSVLEGIPLLYIIVDGSTLGPSFEGCHSTGFWPGICERLFAVLRERGAETVVRVVVTMYGRDKLSNDTGSSTVVVRQANQSRPLRHRGSEVPNATSGRSLHLSKLALIKATRLQNKRKK